MSDLTNPPKPPQRGMPAAYMHRPGQPAATPGERLRAVAAATRPDHGPLLTTEEVADRLRLTPSAVRTMHYRGTGPPSVKVGRRRLYPATALAYWINTQ